MKIAPQAPIKNFNHSRFQIHLKRIESFQHSQREERKKCNKLTIKNPSLNLIQFGTWIKQ